MDYIKYKIIRKELISDEQLPSVRELALDLRVNPNTVQRSYSELERENIVYTKRGLGNFITSDKKIIKNLKLENATKILNQFVTDMKNLGLSKEESIKLIEKKRWDNNDK